MRMSKSKKNKILLLGSVFLLLVILVTAGSYAVISRNIKGDKNYSISIGNLDFSINNELNAISLGSAYPTSDNEGMGLTPYTFELKNNGSKPLSYTVQLVADSTSNLGFDKVKYFIEQDDNNRGPELLSQRTYIYEGTIDGGETLNFSLRLWLDINATIAEEGKVFKGKIEVTGTQVIDELYVDSSGASYPELQGDLVPVVISDTGSVTKANLKQKWYDYEESIWANAVILNDGYGPYQDGASIPEEAIESYFVWIPRYRYKIFDEGNYTSLTAKENKEQAIQIAFESKTVRPSTGTTKGTWLTHPAFTSFDSDGFWVGKFESGYRGATSTVGAQQNSSDYTKLIVKPNVYSWRNITVGNAFKASYDYNRDLDSHMMKNTEWGAVAYLSHSKYGNVASLRINNNSAYITGYSGTEEPTVGYNKEQSREGNRVESTAIGVDGAYTVNYLNKNSAVASTTGNYSGVYDMAGGAWEYVMGYTTGSSIGIGGASNITTLYSKFFDANSEYTKYYDKYSSTSKTNYSNRILGDATGEIGPFFSETDPDGSPRYKSSWYGDYTFFADASGPWFYRGGHWNRGTGSGAFAFDYNTGGVDTNISFRVVLTPPMN